jgi:hypothetical protein
MRCVQKELNAFSGALQLRAVYHLVLRGNVIHREDGLALISLRLMLGGTARSS